MSQTTSLVLTGGTEFALKVGKNVRNIAAETAIAVGHKEAMLSIQNLAFKAAFTNVRHGRYRAAVEILQFAAAPQQFKACTPADDNWNKKRIGMLVELILGRATPKSGKWTAKALIGRQMAHLIDALLEGKPLPPEYAETTTDVKAADPAPTTETPDPLAGVSKPEPAAAPF
jgi:hypothetical protein